MSVEFLLQWRVERGERNLTVSNLLWSRLSIALLACAPGTGLGPSAAGAATLMGTATVQSGTDSTSAGTAEAFQATAGASGTVAQLILFLDRQ